MSDQNKTLYFNGLGYDVAVKDVKVYGYDVYGNKIEIPNNKVELSKDFFKYRSVSRPVKFKTPNMQRKAAMLSSSNQTWQTPMYVYKHLAERNNLVWYDTDPATSKDNPLQCRFYYTEEDDGLTKPWPGDVFINPPFGWGYYKGRWTYVTGLWIEEAWRRLFDKDRIKELKAKFKELKTLPCRHITMILPSRTSTKVFHKYIWDYEKQTTRPGIKINFTRRLKFGTSKMVAPFDTMVIDMEREL